MQTRIPLILLAVSFLSVSAVPCAENPDALGAFEALAGARPEDPLVLFHLERLRTGKTGVLISMAEK